MGALFLLISFMLLPAIVLSPQKFSMFFTLGSVFLLVGFAFMKGPYKYAKNLFAKERLLFSVAYLASIIFTIYASIIVGSYLMTILASALQVSHFH